MGNNFPVIKTNQAIVKVGKHSHSLVVRGLNAIQCQNDELMIAEQDVGSKYRKARKDYDRIIIRCGYIEWRPPNWDTFKLERLHSCYTIFQSLANQGYGKAYFPLSILLMGNQGIHENKQKASYYSNLAFKWCFRNKLKNDPVIWFYLGMMYRSGEATKQNNDLAFFWLTKSAEKDYNSAQFYLGEMYNDGEGVDQNHKTAAFWFQKAAHQHHAAAGIQLAWMYHYGIGIEQDHEKSAQCYWMAHTKEHESAAFYLGVMYENGEGVKLDSEQANHWYQISASHGFKAAEDYLCLVYINEKLEYQGINKVLYCFRKAVEGRDLYAQIDIGYIYENGIGVEKSYKDAFYWYKKSANQDADAYLNIGYMYDKGQGVEKNEELAFYSYLKAINNSNYIKNTT